MKEQIEITLTKKQLHEILHAYKVIGDFLESIMTKEEVYKTTFLQGLEDALHEVKTGQTKPVKTFDEFIK